MLSSSITGDRVANVIDHRERPGRLLGVAEVAQRDETTLGQPAHPLVTWFKDGGELLIGHQRARPRLEGTGGLARRRRGRHLRASLGRADGVGDEDVREPFGDQRPDCCSQGCAAIADSEQRRGVVVASVELLEQRPYGGVTDHGEGVHLLLLDGAPDVGRVHVTRIVGEDKRAALARHDVARPLRSTVHQGRQHEHLEAEPIDSAVAKRLIGADHFPGPDLPATHGGHEDVVLAPEHALGHPCRTACVEDVEVVGARLDRWPGGIRACKRLLVVDSTVDERFS